MREKRSNRFGSQDQETPMPREGYKGPGEKRSTVMRIADGHLPGYTGNHGSNADYADGGDDEMLDDLGLDLDEAGGTS